MFTALYKFLVTLFALLLILVGIIVTPTPAPFGIILIAIGFFLLAAVAPDLVRWLRRKWRWLDRNLNRLEKHLPKRIADQLRKTDITDDDVKPDEASSPEEDTTSNAHANPLTKKRRI